jgi:hypothetical protein
MEGYFGGKKPIFRNLEAIIQDIPYGRPSCKSVFIFLYE